MFFIVRAAISTQACFLHQLHTAARMFRVQHGKLYQIQPTAGKSFSGGSDAHDLVRVPGLLRPVPKQKIRKQILEQQIRADARHLLGMGGPLVLQSSKFQPLSDDEGPGPVGAAVPRVSASGAHEPGSFCAEESGACNAEEQPGGKNDQ